MSLYHKDPDAVLDFAFDWNDTTSPWLASGETISSYTITAQAGITLLTVAPHAHSQAGGKVTFWLSGGTHGSWYNVACKIVTSASRTDERTMIIQVRDR